MDFYRPIWTCGRYNAEKHVALMYNLLAGQSYYFESFSADVIGQILSVSRNGAVDVEQVETATGIAEESIEAFFETLIDEGLLTNFVPTEDDINNKRKSLAESKRNSSMVSEKSTKDKLPFETSTAEEDYNNAVDDGMTVTSVMFELTYNCSEQCIHCYNPGATRNENEISHRADRNELELSDYKRIIDDLCNHGLVKVCLSGGDPFSKPIVWGIIDYLFEKEVAFDIFTNGQRIVDDVERLANFFPRLVAVSIYSGAAEDHDAITRTPGSWNRSMRVLKQLSELAVPMNIKCCVMQPNLHSYYLVAEIAKQIGAQPQFEINISDSVEGDKCARSLRLTEEQLQVVLRDNNIRLYVGPEAPNFGGQSRILDNNACGAGSTSFCITPEGNMQPCCSFPMPFGNLKKQSVNSILQSIELQLWRRATLLDYQECGRNDYCAYCNLCPGLAFSEHGDYHYASENCCYMAKVRHRLAQRMMEGFDPLNGKDFVNALQALPKNKICLQRMNHTKG